ncbi:MAG: NAD+ synthase [Balneolales bacterium]
MRIRSEQLNPIVGDIDGNTDKILNSLKKAEQDNVELLVLPEMCLTGYPPMDLLERQSLLQKVEKASQTIINATGETGIIFGLPTKNPSNTGRLLFNSAILAWAGKILATVNKTLLPTYDVFDESRYFEPNRYFGPVGFKGCKLGITICEDIWTNRNEFNYHTYAQEPASMLAEAGADILINISASPFSRSKPEFRKNMLREHAMNLHIPVVFANQVGANTEMIFDGDSMIIAPDGTVLERTELFKEDFVDAVWNARPKKISPTQNRAPEPKETEREIFEALVLGLRDYFAKSGLPKQVVLGLSGGLDSALTAVIAAEALGHENVTGITMPSDFSSGGSVSDSEKLAENLGIKIQKLPIGDVYEMFLQTLGPVFKDTPFNVAEENLQSRTRGVLLMAIANKFGWLLLNTGNKSELAVGYCTLYGDMAGGISVIADLYKTEAYSLSSWLNEVYYQKEIIPGEIISKEPSAELRPDQKDTDSLPPYLILDGILKAYIEGQKSLKEIIEMGYDPDVSKTILALVDRNEYKRRQAPPGLRVSTKAFGPGRQLPLAHGWKHEIQ